MEKLFNRFKRGTLRNEATLRKPARSIEESDSGNEEIPIRESEEIPASDGEVVPGRVSTKRDIKIPQRFSDYEMYDAYCLLAGDPLSFNEAVKGGEDWKHAIETELNAHKNFGTWYPAELPEGVNPIDTKWVFNTKQNVSQEGETNGQRISGRVYV